MVWLASLYLQAVLELGQRWIMDSLGVPRPRMQRKRRKQRRA